MFFSPRSTTEKTPQRGFPFFNRAPNGRFNGVASRNLCPDWNIKQQQNMQKKLRTKILCALASASSIPLATGCPQATGDARGDRTAAAERTYVAPGGLDDS